MRHGRHGCGHDSADRCRFLIAKPKRTVQKSIPSRHRASLRRASQVSVALTALPHRSSRLPSPSRISSRRISRKGRLPILGDSAAESRHSSHSNRPSFPLPSTLSRKAASSSSLPRVSKRARDSVRTSAIHRTMPQKGARRFQPFGSNRLSSHLRRSSRFCLDLIDIGVFCQNVRADQQAHQRSFLTLEPPLRPRLPQAAHCARLTGAKRVPLRLRQAVDPHRRASARSKRFRPDTRSF